MAEETKAQRIERLKREQSGLDVLPTLFDEARDGGELSADTIDRMKYYGLYTQKKHQDDPPGQYLLVRIKLEGGEISREQLAQVAELSRRYARSSFDLTTRQDIQLHWVRPADLEHLFSQLEQIGLTTRMAAGDCVRNIVSCPASGHHADELYDVRPLLKQLNQHFDSNRALINLPRKFKIAVSGCHLHCIRHEIQDLSFVAVPQDGKVVFDLTVGGGLSSGRQFAQRLERTCQPDQVLAVSDAVAHLFHDYGNRENRSAARLRHLIQDWGLEKFRDELENRLDFVLGTGQPPQLTALAKRHHYGSFDSHNRDTCGLGIKTSSGKLGAETVSELVDLMEQHHSDLVRLTPTQDLLLLNLEKSRLPEVVEEIHALGLQTAPGPLRLHSTACTGLTYCKFALSETKEFTEQLLKKLEQRFPEWKKPLTIAVSGCPHGCSHPIVADIGLVGCKIKDPSGESVGGYDIYLGGRLNGTDSRFAERNGIRLPSYAVAGYLENLLQQLN